MIAPLSRAEWPVATVRTLARRYRVSFDGQGLVRAPRTGMHEFDEDTPIVPYDFGESLAGGAVTAHEVDAISPDETAFHIV